MENLEVFHNVFKIMAMWINVAEPPEPEAKPRRRARKVEGRAEQKNYTFLLEEEFFGGARKSENAKTIFLRAVPFIGTAFKQNGRNFGDVKPNGSTKV